MSGPEPEPEPETIYEAIKKSIIENGIHSVLRKELAKFHPDGKSVDTTSDFQIASNIGKELEEKLSDCWSECLKKK